MRHYSSISKHLFSEENVKKYLDYFSECLKNKQFKICLDRDKNNDFLEDYQLTTNDLYQLLSELTYLNFCTILVNDNPKYPKDLLYVFGLTKTFEVFGDFEEVELYIKINTINTNNSCKFAIVISIHPAKYPMNYHFK